MRTALVTTLVALPVLASADSKVIEMPAESMRPAAQTQVATAEEALASTEPAIVEEAPPVGEPAKKDKWIEPYIAIAGGMRLRSDPAGIVTFAVLCCFLPAAVLSAVSPTVVKIQLRDLAQTGTVVGRLSAIGTAGVTAGDRRRGRGRRCKRGSDDVVL